MITQLSVLDVLELLITLLLPSVVVGPDGEVEQVSKVEAVLDWFENSLFGGQ